MSQWYVKELSKLTDISVQTLHHYDRIGLLKPSVRLPNGYRLYSEKDLLKLQQIIALKFFGFELVRIRKLLDKSEDVLENLSKQADFLTEKSKNLFEASSVLQNIISECKHNKSIPWETIIKIIEVYRMTEKLEHAWAKDVFTNDELNDFVDFVKEQKEKPIADQKAIENEWNAIVNQVEQNLDKDPNSEVGIEIGKRCMIWVKGVYGDNVKLRNAVWEKGFKGGKSQQIDPDLSQEGVAWLDKAVDAYHRDRAGNIFRQLGKESDAIILNQWKAFLKEIYGDDQVARQEVLHFVMNEKSIPAATKEWLKKHTK